MLNLTKSPFPVLVIAAIAVSVIIAANAQLYEAAIRNLAFVHLAKFVLQPTLALDESLTRSRHLFGTLVTNYDDSRYAAYALRLDGWTTALSDDNAIINDITIEDDSDNVSQFIQTIAHGSVQMRDETAPKLLALLNNTAESDWPNLAFGKPKLISSSPSSVANNCEDPELISAYIGEEQIAARETVPVVLLWRMISKDLRGDIVLNSTDRSLGWELWRDGQFLLQRGLVYNQIPDGGFEQTVLPYLGFPASLPKSLYARQTQQHSQLVYESPQIARNIVLAIDGRGKTSAGLGSLPMPVSVSHDHAYLVTGRYRTEGTAEPRIGLRWLLKGGKEWNDNVSSYIVRTQSEQWTPFAGVLSPPPDAESYQYWALNADAHSQLFVDNLGVFAIPLPCEVQ